MLAKHKIVPAVDVLFIFVCSLWSITDFVWYKYFNILIRNSQELQYALALQYNLILKLFTLPLHFSFITERLSVSFISVCNLLAPFLNNTPTRSSFIRKMRPQLLHYKLYKCRNRFNLVLLCISLSNICFSFMK